MNWGSPEFVIFIVGISTVGWVVNNWIRARHGYALEDEWGGKTPRNDALIAENKELRAQLSKVNERLQVLERIATDNSVNVARQIEALREGEKV